MGQILALRPKTVHDTPDLVVKFLAEWPERQGLEFVIGMNMSLHAGDKEYGTGFLLHDYRFSLTYTGETDVTRLKRLLPVVNQVVNIPAVAYPEMQALFVMPRGREDDVFALLAEELKPLAAMVFYEVGGKRPRPLRLPTLDVTLQRHKVIRRRWSYEVVSEARENPHKHLRVIGMVDAPFGAVPAM